MVVNINQYIIHSSLTLNTLDNHQVQTLIKQYISTINNIMLEQKTGMYYIPDYGSSIIKCSGYKNNSKSIIDLSLQMVKANFILKQ